MTLLKSKRLLIKLKNLVAPLTTPEIKDVNADDSEKVEDPPEEVQNADINRQTLVQVREALEEVEAARENSSLSGEDRKNLELASVQLRNIERAIIKQKEQALLKTLKEDSKGLQELTAKIKASAASLEKLAAVVEKATKMVELLIKAVAAGLSAGIL